MSLERALRVLQILHTDETGGIRTLANMVADGLREHGHSVETMYLYRDRHLAPARKLVSTLAAGIALLRSSADVVIAYQATASILVGTAGRIGRRRLRLVHQTAMPSATAWVLRLIDRIVGSLGGYSFNVMNSKATMACFASYPASYRRHIVLIEHGMAAIQPDRDRQATRGVFGLPEQAVLLLNVGRLTAQKNQQVVIRALRNMPDVVLAVAGGGELETEYRTLARAEGIEDRIYFLGDVPPQEVANLLAAADLFVFPSIWETFGLAGVEAAIAGLPIVASDLPVLHEVLGAVEGAPVRFADPQSPDVWLREISDLLKERPPTATYAAEMASRFSRKRMIEKYVGLLGK